MRACLKRKLKEQLQQQNNQKQQPRQPLNLHVLDDEVFEGTKGTTLHRGGSTVTVLPPRCKVLQSRINKQDKQ